MLNYENVILKEEVVGNKRYRLYFNPNVYGRDSDTIQFTIVKYFNNVKVTLSIHEFKNCNTRSTIKAKKQRMNTEFYSLIDYLKNTKGSESFYDPENNL